MTDILAQITRYRPRIFSSQNIVKRTRNAGLLYLLDFVNARSEFKSFHTANSVHQMRVSLRRLRTVFYIIKRFMPHPSFIEYDLKMRHFSKKLGEARDKDVIMAWLDAVPFTPEQFFARDAFVSSVSAYREIAYRDIGQLLDSQELVDTVLSLAKVLHRKFNVSEDWSRKKCKDLEMRIIKNLYKKANKLGHNLSSLSADDRHHFRITLKRLRYGLEFIALDASNKSDRKCFKKSLEQLLDELGAAQDIWTISRITMGELFGQSNDVSLVSGILVGWYSRTSKDIENSLVKKWQRFISSQVFWLA